MPARPNINPRSPTAPVRVLPDPKPSPIIGSRITKLLADIVVVVPATLRAPLIFTVPVTSRVLELVANVNLDEPLMVLVPVRYWTAPSGPPEPDMTLPSTYAQLNCAPLSRLLPHLTS